MTTPQLPAHLQNYQSRQLARTVAQNLGVSSPPYLSIAGNRFTLIDSAGNAAPVETYDPKLGPYLDCVIVDVHDKVSKIFYDSDYDPKAVTFMPPGCWSDNGIGPSRQAGNPQSPTCAACPNNMWGSATSKVSGKGVKACSDYQKVAIVVPGFAKEMVFLLRIPPNSLKNFRAYAEQYNGQQFDIDVIKTRVSFEPQGVGTLMFSPVDWSDAATEALRQKLLAAKATDAMIGRTDAPREAALPAPTQAPQTQSAPSVGQQAAIPAFAPPAQPLATPTPPSTPTPNGQGTANIASSSEQPRRRGRRSAAEIAAAQAAPAPGFQPAAQPAPQATQGFQPAPFRPNAEAANLIQAPTAPGPAFGIGGGVAPNPEVAAALKGVFGS